MTIFISKSSGNCDTHTSKTPSQTRPGREHFTFESRDADGVPAGRRLYVYPSRSATPGDERLWEERPIGKNSIDPIKLMNEYLKVKSG